MQPESRDHATGDAPPASGGVESPIEGEARSTIAREGKEGDLAIVLSGGGARAAYQVGVVRCLAKNLPHLRFPIITGVSAGAINAAFFASHPGPLAEAASALCDLWAGLQVEDIFRVDTTSLARHFTRWASRLVSGGTAMTPEVRGLVDTRPLYTTLQRASATVDGEIIGIERNLERGTLKAVALTALNYSTGQTVTWVQGDHTDIWNQPQRRSVHARISVDHIMASAALPLFFPAVRLGNDWYGDGGVRLSAPIAPALRLGATRILAISPRYDPSFEEAERPKTHGYPPPAQILGHLMDAIFLDVLDEDVRRLKSLNPLIAKLPPEERGGLRPVDIRVLRPSRDLGQLASQYEPRLPPAFRYLTRSLGTKETDTSDFLSMLMFQPDYLQKLIEIGEEDAAAQLPDIRELVGESPSAAPEP
ncbi:MAG TPA: patatin-like phospholipase family protein [Thermoanaerobaculia bacterium]|nr:patatin-like phospholipase family protein [Thermoanaerobaculia bacterium]